MSDKLKGCPLPKCGGAAELDGWQGYRNIETGRIENQSAIYCTKCGIQISLCHSEVGDMSHEDINNALILQWNDRPATLDAEKVKAYLRSQPGIGKHGNAYAQGYQAAIIDALDAINSGNLGVGE